MTMVARMVTLLLLQVLPLLSAREHLIAACIAAAACAPQLPGNLVTS
jgi:hypothetical protein